MKNPEDVIEPRSEYGNLPPELRAMQKMMDMVFGAIAAPQAVPKGSEATQIASSHRPAAEPAAAAPDLAPRRIDIETAIMHAPGFDYLLASEIFAALQRRLELRYEDRLDMTLETMMQDLATAFDRLTGMGK